MFKKSVAITAFLLIISVFLNACSLGQAFPLIIDSTPITDEEFLYFLDRAKADDPGADSAAVVSSAKQAVQDYYNLSAVYDFLVQTQALELSVAEKTDLSHDVNSLWGVYGAYYDKIGVSKQTLYDVKRSEAYKTAILKEYYGENGSRTATSAEALEAEFNNTFAAFSMISIPLYTQENGVRAVFDENKKSELAETFRAAALQIGGEVTMDTVNAQLTGSQAVPETFFMRASTEGYPEGFFALVKSCEVDKTAVFELEDTLYLVRRENILVNYPDFYSSNRDAILYDMYAEDFAKTLAELSAAHTVEFNEKHAARLNEKLEKALAE
ncbi:MAG: hypothetical protein GX851_05880 [Clostridiales bacterium]|nr:hypothetical protein [Clostridiales bacterium]